MLNINTVDLIQQRREKRKELIEERKREVYSRIPRIGEIENRLTSTGMLLLTRVADTQTSPEEAVAAIMAENKAYSEEMTRLLSENGFSPDYLNPPYLCVHCSDTGYTKNGALCSCLKAELTARALKESNLTSHMAGQTFENFNLAFYDNEAKSSAGMTARENAASILTVARDFVKSFDSSDTNLLFYGPSGLGKTFLSSAIATELLKCGKDVLYISANSLFPSLESIHFGRQNEQSLFISQKALDCDLLILDDLGAEFVTAFTASELFRIMNQRLLSGKKMVFSTNLTLPEIERTYSERIVSRIIGSFEALRFFGEDIRKKKKYL